MAARLFLVRHGKTHWNKQGRYQGHGDSPLLPESRDSLKKLGESLKDCEFDYIFCSPIGRTRETLDILNPMGPAPVFHDHLKEINLGVMEGVLWENPPEELRDTSRTFWKNPEDFTVPEGESFYDVRNRVSSFIDQNLSTLGGNVLLVTHTVIIKTFLAFAEQRPVRRIWEEPRIPPGSISSFTLSDGVLSVEAIGKDSFPL